MPFRTVRLLKTICIFGSLVFCGIAYLFQNSIPVLMACAVIAMGLFVSHFVILLLFWRCPHCGSWLPGRSLWITYCPHCGKALEAEY